MRKELKTENDVKALVKSWLNERRYFHFPIPANGMGVNGVSDRLSIIRPTGIFLAIEAKRPGRRNEPFRGCSRNQFTFIKNIAESGGFGWVVDGQEDLDELQMSIMGISPRRSNLDAYA